LSQLWQQVKQSFTPKALNQSAQMILDAEKNVPNAVGRGVAGAADAISNTAVRGSVELSKKTGAYKLGRTPEQQDEFLKWWDQPTDDANPLQFGEDRIRRWLGPAQGGLTGFIENASQFSVGLALTGKILPVGGVLGSMVKGAVTDATAFDPHVKRLSNLIQSGPEWMRNPLTEALQSEGSDNEALARFKASAEGLLLGGTIEAVSHGVRGLKKLWRRETLKEPRSVQEGE
jgi:hypothetical protein